MFGPSRSVETAVVSLLDAKSHGPSSEFDLIGAGDITPCQFCRRGGTEKN